MANQADPVLVFFQDQAHFEPRIEKIILYGSRARGDHGPKSDYDFAVLASEIDPSGWIQWMNQAKENVPTLLGVDLILLNSETSIDLRNSIEKEGKVIYERPKNK